MVKPRKTTKSPPFPSHEFFIQNHGDIAVSVLGIFCLGLIFQVSNPICSKVIFMNYNISTENVSSLQDRPHKSEYYVSGPLDWCNIIYYSLGFVVLHAAIQEYILDKIVKKSLSKSKLSRFTESAHLGLFYVLSLASTVYICKHEQYPFQLNFLWSDYPHIYHVTQQKVFFLCQISYWIHIFPELYLQKVRREDIPNQVTYASLYLVFITAGYFTNFGRLTIFLLALHYACEAIFHFSRIMKISDKEGIASMGFLVWSVVFVVVRLSTIVLSFLILWIGLGRSSIGNIDVKNGNFNTGAVRFTCLAGIALLQLWMMWHFLNFQMKYKNDRALAKEATRNLEYAEAVDSESDSSASPKDTPQHTPKKTNKLRNRKPAPSANESAANQNGASTMRLRKK